MKQQSWPFVAMVSCLIGSVLLTELVLCLDLVVIILLIPWQAVIGAALFSVAFVAIFFGFIHRRGWKLQFSTRLLLVLGLMVAWPVSRFAFEARLERNRIRVQQECFDMAISLKPFSKQIASSGRYNDGRSDFAIQRWLIGLFSMIIDLNQIRFEIMSLVSLDLTGTNIVDDQLSTIANTHTVQELNLTSTNITDAGLVHLHELHSLRSLTLTNTTVSKAAIEALKNKLPAITIVP
jgi:hypothetical protein